MEKMKMESADGVQNNIKKIAELFPNCVTETLDKERSTPENPVYKKAINLKMLNQMLSDQVLEGDEAYEMTWVGKKAAIVEANKPIRKTLRPCPEESVNWDTTDNLYIEGDNLEVLKLLQESYLGKVKMIYIDPPYNTGSDVFIYNDNFETDRKSFQESMGVVEDEIILQNNVKSNGRFHSHWCSMMYSRLLLAKNLLTEDGAIFISIDDNEIDNLSKITSEIFGEENFVAQVTVIVKPEGRRYGTFAKSHEYLLVYAKNINKLQLNEITIEGKTYSYFDHKGGFNIKGLRNRNVQAFNSINRPNLRYSFFADLSKPDVNGFYPVTPINQDGFTEITPSTVNGLESVWRWGKEKSMELKEDLIAQKSRDGEIRIFQKERKLTQTPKTHWEDKNFISNKGTKEVQALLGKGIFDFPKPVELVKRIVQIGSSDNDIILDFFSGSSTTAQAVIEINNENRENRRFILIQIPEKCPESSPAYKAGYQTITDIGKARIKKINDNNHNENWNTAGFRVFKCATSNFQNVFYHPEELSQNSLFDLVTNIKSNRTDLDLFFGCILDWGLPLSLPYSTKTIDGFTVHNYNDGDLIACFEENVSEELVREIASHQPMRAVFRDSSFGNSPEKINVFEIFKKYMPEDADDITKRVKVI